jgi:type II secretory pathway pseudopilin PulG
MHRALRRQAGFQLLELLAVLAVAALLGALGVPPLLRASAESRARLAAAEIVGVLRLASSYAVRHGVNVAVKFRLRGEEVTWELCRDGDGDGVLSADIASGVDPTIEPPRRLQHVGRDVRFGFPPGAAPRDPGDPRRRLDRLDDPIRFNRSDLASFDPLGGATPGSVYLTDGDSRLVVVRVFGSTGKVRTASYDRRSQTWH